jgi:serine/threonine protein kinase
MSKVFTITEGLENMGALRTGGQGSVYKARRMGPIISAVKLLPTPIYTEDKDDKNFRNFQNEVDKLKKVNEDPNPNVVKILNSGLTESGSFPFIEMEFIEGPDLEELLKPPHEKIFTIKETLKLADQLANALAHCHKVGVKHGDIKSNNIKYNVNSGNYVLLDFGLAIMSDEQRRTSMRQAGAIEFMAPEQNNGQMLFQTDIYSFGVVIYELLTGQVPFPLQGNGETSRNTVMVAHLESPVPDLLKIRSKNLPTTWSDEKKELEMRVPAQLLQVIYKCLEKDPQNRFVSGEQLQDALITSYIVSHNISSSNQAISSGKVIDNNHRVSISRPVFAILLVALVIALIFAFAGMFHKNIQYVTVPAYKPFWETFDKYKPKLATHAKFNALIDTTLNENLSRDDSVKVLVYRRSLIHSHKKVSRVKRKKFLGIF